MLFFFAFFLLTSRSIGLEKCSPAGWSVPPPPKDHTLHQVTAIIRHGDRVPASGDVCWPNDDAVWDCTLTHAEIPIHVPSEGDLSHRLYTKVYASTNEELNGNCSVGQLTSKGYDQHLSNGWSLNAAYVKTKFLTSFNPEDIWLQSDDMPRTLQSAQAITLGMFPPSDKPELFPIHTRDFTYDYMIANELLCPRFGVYSNNFSTSQIVKSHAPVTEDVMKRTSQILGLKISSLEELDHAGDCLNTHYCHNMSWPSGMTEDIASDIQQEISWYRYHLYKFPSVEGNARVGIGFLLRDIWKNINNAVSGQQTRKFYLYSGHDTTLIPVLVALKIDDGVWPHYAAMILIELYKTPSSGFAIRIIYNGKVVTPAFCNDNPVCDYHTFNQYMIQVTPPTNYTELCKSS